MSRPKGGYIGFNRVPAESAANSAASGIWTLREAEALKRAGTWPFPTPPTPPVEASLLLNFNGDNDSTTFTDSSVNGLTVTRVGTPVISTAESKFGGASGLFDGSGDRLTLSSATPFQDWGTEDWTLEMWLYPNNVSGYRSIFLSANRFNLHIFNTGDLYVNDATTGSGGIIASGVLTTGQWQHVAVSRKDGTTSLYVDGDREASTAVPYGSGSGNVSIGGDSSGTYSGYMDDLRFIKGLALYDGATITPPTAELGPIP